MIKSTNDFSVNQFLFKFRTLMKRKNPFIPESKRIFIFWAFSPRRTGYLLTDSGKNKYF